MLTVKSPLKAWAGSIKLPEPDDFSGVHWRIWKDGVNKEERKEYALTHVYFYVGLELIKAAGEWKLKPSLEEVQKWENVPEDERLKLLGWLGKTILVYMDGIVNPKE